MTEINKKLAELKTYIGSTVPEEREKMAEIIEWLKQNATEGEARKQVESFIDCGINAEINDLERLRDQISDVYSILPISYIAKHYFGKSTAWLTQRINGNKVRGKVYTLNDEQKKIFNDAVQDVAKKIGSVCIT